MRLAVMDRGVHHTTMQRARSDEDFSRSAVGEDAIAITPSWMIRCDLEQCDEIEKQKNTPIRVPLHNLYAAGENRRLQKAFYLESSSKKLD